MSTKPTNSNTAEADTWGLLMVVLWWALGCVPGDIWARYFDIEDVMRALGRCGFLRVTFDEVQRSKWANIITEQDYRESKRLAE